MGHPLAARFQPALHRSVVLVTSVSRDKEAVAMSSLAAPASGGSADAQETPERHPALCALDQWRVSGVVLNSGAMETTLEEYCQSMITSMRAHVEVVSR